MELHANPSGKSSSGEGDSSAPGKYPSMKHERHYEYNFLLRLLIMVSVVIGSTSILINIMTYSGDLWSLVVSGTIILLWITVAYPLYIKRNIGHFIIVDVISLSAFIYMVELSTQSKGWGLTYVTPFLFIAATLMITFILVIKRLNWREYTVYQTIMVILGFLPPLFCAFKLVTVVWPSILSAFYSFLTVTGMYIFVHKKYGDELKKRFHI